MLSSVLILLIDLMLIGCIVGRWLTKGHSVCIYEDSAGHTILSWHVIYPTVPVHALHLPFTKENPLEENMAVTML